MVTTTPWMISKSMLRSLSSPMPITSLFYPFADPKILLILLATLTQSKENILPFLLVDFGTTSTKSALVDLDSGAFSHILRHPAIPNCAAPSGHYEIPLDAIRARFLAICTHYYDHLKVHF